ncbi:hypothetical protein ANN_13666 [Periplaneta americana]|uniref:Uncharacterized protein n=1 Tax=Periplaneta americana TaxID=6978 RepID=A0ABQ8TK15_PERAM|nr:hypothetical protein ANN_13666 [Periplaneta americana]
MAGLCEGGNEPPGSLKATSWMESKTSEARLRALFGIIQQVGWRAKLQKLFLALNWNHPTSCMESKTSAARRRAVFEIILQVGWRAKLQKLVLELYLKSSFELDGEQNFRSSP